MMTETPSNNIISTILRHDAKITSYKIALLRAINDLALSFPDVGTSGQDVIVPLRILSEFWIAYYWPFVAPNQPIWQGARSVRSGIVRNDMAFRSDLTELREAWEETIGLVARPSEGFIVMNEMRVPRMRANQSPEVQTAYEQALKSISKTLEMPIRYAGPGQWTVFEKPFRYKPSKIFGVPIPGTRPNDKCLRIPAEIWSLFLELSLWIEALCIHEWALFVEKVDQTDTVVVDRGDVYRLLTDRPDNRRPLTWERNQIDILLMEGSEFQCPWTRKRIRHGTEYDLDHLLPVSVYPINEIWNLAPSDRDFNQNKKRDRLPGPEPLMGAQPILARTYGTYTHADALAEALYQDVTLRFTTVNLRAQGVPEQIAAATVMFIEQIANSRNLARF